MSGLGPEARALIEAATREESLPSERALRRMRRSVALKAMAAGAAFATGSSTLGAKAGLLGAGVAVQIASLVVAGVLTGGALVAVSPAWKAPRRADPSAHARMEGAPAQSFVKERVRSFPYADETVDTQIADESAKGAPPSNLSPLPAAAKLDMAPEPRKPPPGTARVTGAPTSSLAGAMSRSPLPPPAEGPADPGPRDLSNHLARGAHTDPHPADRPAHSLALELQILREARKELGEGRASQVLEILGKYDDLFRGGALEEESRTARVAALCQLGRYEQARIDIADALRRWPNSPIAQMANDCH